MKTISQSKRVKVANEEWRYLLDKIEMSEDANVIYERSIIDTPTIKWPGISHEKDGTINQHIAEYYNKKHPTIIFAHEKIKNEIASNNELAQAAREIKQAMKVM